MWNLSIGLINSCKGECYQIKAQYSMNILLLVVDAFPQGLCTKAGLVFFGGSKLVTNDTRC